MANQTITHRRFELHRDVDVSGISGTGVVAEGVAFTDGVVALRWRSAWPTSVVFHDKGMDAVEAVHGHGGATRIVWLDEGPAALFFACPQCGRTSYHPTDRAEGYCGACHDWTGTAQRAGESGDGNG